MYPVVETFYSLQGEGMYAGTAAFFIRLAGCPVKCAYCDEMRRWDAAKYLLKSAEELAVEAATTIEVATSATVTTSATTATTVEAATTKAQIAIITGGEPTIHNLAPLTNALKAKNINTHLETAGIKPLTGTWDHITLSPKRNMPPLKEYYAKANEIKVVIESENDFIVAEQQREQVKRAKWQSPQTHQPSPQAHQPSPQAQQPFAKAQQRFLLQPEWNNRVAITATIINYIKQNPQWQLSLQIHKYIDIK
jgi:organic radical activating enzyme